MYGTVEWVNVTDHIGKVKKSAEFENIVFVFKTGITILCRERLKKKKAKVKYLKKNKGLKKKFLECCTAHNVLNCFLCSQFC